MYCVGRLRCPGYPYLYARTMSRLGCSILLRSSGRVRFISDWHIRRQQEVTWKIRQFRGTSLFETNWLCLQYGYILNYSIQQKSYLVSAAMAAGPTPDGIPISTLATGVEAPEATSSTVIWSRRMRIMGANVFSCPGAYRSYTGSLAYAIRAVAI